ncbi:MAG: hypothetical protein GTO18_14760 [Anaerolineales bacterium]|nr:hypothetical protein [Anaerolineales bacterium]
MKIMLLGVGMQGKAALHDLVLSKYVSEILAADLDIASLEAHVGTWDYGDKVKCEPVDASSPDDLDRLMAWNPDVLIDLLPVPLIPNVAAVAVSHGVHLVNTSFLQPEVQELAENAKKRGISILPEFGLDPGIDLVLFGEAVRSLETVEEIALYGSGIPEAEAANNPIQYKVSWTFEGVLRSYHRPASLIRNGAVVNIPESEIFSPENVHEVEIQELGRLEAFPNGDALRYLDLLGVDPSDVRTMGRYTMRWPGHCAFWKSIVDLHLLDSDPVMLDGYAVDKVRYLTEAIGPHIQYGPDERDLAILRVVVKGKKDGKESHSVYQLIDRRDLDTGFSAMSRTVGYTASIGAQMLGSGEITKRGILSPVTDIPFAHLVGELDKRGIHVRSEISNLP